MRPPDLPPSAQADAPGPVDRFVRWILRVGHRVVSPWIHGPRRRQGVAVAVWRGRELLLVRRSYEPGWVLPGGAANRAESLLAAARRELAEETGIEADPNALVPAFTTAWIRIYEYCPVQAPALRVDGREIVEARFVDPDRFAGLPESLADYLLSRVVEGAPRRGVGG